MKSLYIFVFSYRICVFYVFDNSCFGAKHVDVSFPKVTILEIKFSFLFLFCYFFKNEKYLYYDLVYSFGSRQEYVNILYSNISDLHCILAKNYA